MLLQAVPEMFLTLVVMTCRGAVHLSLLALYGFGGYLVSRGLLPIRVLLSAIGFTFSLVFATQGVVQTFSDARRVSAGLARSVLNGLSAQICILTRICRTAGLQDCPDQMIS